MGSILRPGSPLAAWQVWPRVGGQWPTYNIESPQADGLVAWWPTITAGESILHDRTYRGIDGSFPGGTKNPSWINSQVGMVLDYDGSDDYIDLGNVSLLDPGLGSFTAFAWIWASSVHSMRIVQKRGTGAWGSQAGWQLSWVAGHWGNSGVDDGSNYVRITDLQDFTWADSTWHLITMRWDAVAEHIDLFRDGIDQGLANSTEGAIGSISSARNATIGAAWNDAATQAQWFNGMIGDVRYYNVWLADSEIYEHYVPTTRFDLYQIPRRVWAIEAAVARRIFITHC